MKNLLLAMLACVVVGFGAAMNAQHCGYEVRVLQCTFAICVAAACGIPVLFMGSWKTSHMIVCLLIILGICGPFVVSGRMSQEKMQTPIVNLVR